jgi:ANTAR domain
MMETESDQTPDAGDSRRRPEQYESNEPADWPGDDARPRVSSRPRAPGGGRPRPDGYRQPRPDGYGQQGPDGYGQQRPGAYDQQRPESYSQQRSDGYDQQRPDGHDQRRPDAYDQRRSDAYGRPRPDGYGRPRPDRYEQQRPDGYRGRHSPTAVTTDGQRRSGGDSAHGDVAPQYRLADPPVARRTPTGWRVGDEEVSDLTSAMVLADLLAADLPAEGPPTPGGQAASAAASRRADEPPPNVRQLQETVAQLEHALTVRVRVEQAIGVLAERHRLRPRQAFELLRSAARSRGRRVLEVAGEVVESASNPLLRLPEELAKAPVARRRGRASRRPHDSE